MLLVVYLLNVDFYESVAYFIFRRHLLGRCLMHKQECGTFYSKAIYSDWASSHHNICVSISAYNF